MARRPPTDEYTVGYGRPPAEHQFRKGESGNPRGRPKKAKSADLLQLIRSALEKPIDLTVNGVRRRMTVMEAAAARFSNDLITASPPERLKLLLILEKLGVLHGLPEPQHSTPEERKAFLEKLAMQTQKLQEEEQQRQT